MRLYLPSLVSALRRCHRHHHRHPHEQTPGYHHHDDSSSMVIHWWFIIIVLPIIFTVIHMNRSIIIIFIKELIIIIVTIFRRYESVSTSRHHGPAHALQGLWTIAASTMKQLWGFCHQLWGNTISYQHWHYQLWGNTLGFLSSRFHHCMVKIGATINIVGTVSSLLEIDIQFKSEIARNWHQI